MFLGITLGLLMRTEGFAWWVSVLMSAVIYSGALEFAAVPLLGAGFDPVGAFVLGLMLSARHLFYGIPMLKKYKGAGARKPFLIFGLTDETFSILSVTDAPEGAEPRRFYGWVTGLDYLYWTGGTAIGALLGELVTVDLQGLDFALTALFVVLFTEQMRTPTGRRSGLAGLAVSLAVLAVCGADVFVLVSMVCILAALLAGRKVLVRE